MPDTYEGHLDSPNANPIILSRFSGEADNERTFKVIVTTGNESTPLDQDEQSVRWVDVFLQPEGEPRPHPIGRAKMTDTVPSTRLHGGHSLYHYHEAVLEFRIDASGMIRTSLLQQSKTVPRC